ncbi:uncharacterized protein AAGF69_016344 isoform 3-T3 [Amazona ochrocephala]
MRSKRCRELCWREGCSLKKDLQVYISCSFHVLSPNPSGYEQRQQHLDNANAKIQAWKCRKRKPEVFGSCSVPVHRHMQTHQQLLWVINFFGHPKTRQQTSVNHSSESTF